MKAGMAFAIINILVVTDAVGYLQTLSHVKTAVGGIFDAP